MSEPELLLDSDIRIWVFLPIVLVTFLVGILRHYISVLIATQKKVDLPQVQDRCVAFIVCTMCFHSVYFYFIFQKQKPFLKGLSSFTKGIILTKIKASVLDLTQLKEEYLNCSKSISV